MQYLWEFNERRPDCGRRKVNDGCKAVLNAEAAWLTNFVTSWESTGIVTAVCDLTFGINKTLNGASVQEIITIFHCHQTVRLCINITPRHSVR